MVDQHLENVLSPAKFIKEVEEFVKKTNEPYIDAIVHLCQKKGIEIEAAASIMKNSSVMKSKLQLEAEDAGYLPKKAKLPIEK